MKNYFTQKGFSALSLIIVGVTLLAIPLGVVLVQQQTQVKSKATASVNCIDNPEGTNAPGGFTWKANCGSQCTSNSQCSQNTTDTCNINPASSSWCYGFGTGNTADWRCLQYQRVGGGTSSCGGSSSGQAPACDPSAVNMTVSPNPVSANSQVRFSVSGSQGSTNIDDTWSGGVTCSGGFWGDKTCTANTAGNFTWTHKWRNCVNTNCSPTQCSKSVNFAVTGASGGSSCASPATISFIPPNPRVGTPFIIRAYSSTGYTGVGLNQSAGPGSAPTNIPLNTNGSTNWDWTINPTNAGDYRYTFTVNNGQACGTGQVTIDPASTAPPTAPPITFVPGEITGTLTDRDNGVSLTLPTGGTANITRDRYTLRAHAKAKINNAGIIVYKDGESTWRCGGGSEVVAGGTKYCYIQSQDSPPTEATDFTFKSKAFSIDQVGIYKVVVDVVQKPVAGDTHGSWKCYGSDIPGLTDFACSNDISTTMKTLIVISPRGKLCLASTPVATFNLAWREQLIQRASTPADFSTDCDEDGFVEVEDYNIWRDIKRSSSS